MQIRLDQETALWFRRLFRPGALSQFHEIRQGLEEVWDEERSTLDLTPRLDDLEFLTKLAEIILMSGFGHVYRDEFTDLARRIATAGSASIVDRLAAIQDPPPPIEIRSSRDARRQAAIDRIKERYNPRG